MANHLIHGDNIKVRGGSGRVAVINSDNIDTADYEANSTIINSGALIVTPDGLSTTTIALTQAIKTADFTAGAEAYNVYFVDCTASDIDITIEHSQRPLYIFKTDVSANVINLIPASGLINGQASVSITTQYESRIIFSDGTAMYTVSGGGSGSGSFGTGGIVDLGNWTDQGELNLGNYV